MPIHSNRSVATRLRRVAMSLCAIASISLPAVAGAQGLVFGQGVPIDQLTPVPIYQVTMPWVRAIYDTLVVWEGGKAVPSLAQSWEVSSDNTVYTLKLHSGVTFHNGAPLTVQTVVDNFQWAADPKNRVNGTGIYKGAEFSSPAPDEVRIKFTRPTPQALATMALMPIIDLKANIATAPNGTGPFKVASFASGSDLKLVRNDQYWDKTRMPELPSYELRILPDNAAAMAALVSHQIDGIAFPDFRQIAAMKKAGIEMVAQKPSANFVLRVNASKGPLANKKLRQALSFAIERKVFADKMVGGIGDPTCSAYPKDSVAYEKSIDADCKFDLAKAKQLLTEAGFGNGLTLTMLVSSVRQPEWATYAPLFQEDLAKIGVKLNLLEVSPSIMQQRVSSGDYELQGVWYGWGTFDPAFLFVDEAFAPTVNTAWFREPAYLDMIEAAQAETDPAARLEKYRAINKYILDQAFMIPVSSRPYIYAIRPGVTGFAFDEFGMAYVNKTKVAQ